MIINLIPQIPTKQPVFQTGIPAVFFMCGSHGSTSCVKRGLRHKTSLAPTTSTCFSILGQFIDGTSLKTFGSIGFPLGRFLYIFAHYLPKMEFVDFDGKIRTGKYIPDI